MHLHSLTPTKPAARSKQGSAVEKIHTGEWISEGGHDHSRCSLTLAWKWMPCWYASSLCSGTLESARSSTRLYLFLAGIARAQEGEPHYSQKAKQLDVLAPLSASTPSDSRLNGADPVTPACVNTARFLRVASRGALLSLRGKVHHGDTASLRHPPPPHCPARGLDRLSFLFALLLETERTRADFRKMQCFSGGR